MLVLLNFIPKCCPNCGNEILKTDGAKSDYQNKASLRCECGVNFQMGDSQPILNAAVTSGGDLDDAQD